MFAYNPAVNDNRDQYIMAAANTQANSMKQLGSDIGGALASIGNMYGKYKDKKDMLAGMDQSVNAMSDIGAVTADFRDRYMNAPANVRPFLFEAVASPMLKSFSAGQSAAAQAQAWDQYKNNGSGMPGGARNQYGYFYQGP